MIVTVRNVVIDELMTLLENMRSTPGVTHIDITCDDEKLTVDIYPITNTKEIKKPIKRKKDSGLNLNDLPS